MRKILLAIMFLATAAAAPLAETDVDLSELNGSDLGMGVGARAISMAGAFVGLGDDASALYWNPAAITEIPQNELMMMSDLQPVTHSFKAMVYSPPAWRKNRSKITIGFARTNRLRYQGYGDWRTGNADHLIDLSMIDLDPDEFQEGGIVSRTYDWRFTIAGRWPGREDLSVGLTYINFECVTTFYAETNTCKTPQIVQYDTVDIGFHYRESDRRHFGLSLRNPFEKTKPKYINAGVAWFRGRDIFTFDIEHIYGNYSSYMRTVNFLMLRAGMERGMKNNWKIRGGLVIPVRARTSTLGDVRAKLPSPKIDATFGAGYSYGRYTMDLAVYGDPGWGLIKEKLKASSVLTLRMAF